jgi:hypothetical protein
MGPVLFPGSPRPSPPVSRPLASCLGGREVGVREAAGVRWGRLAPQARATAAQRRRSPGTATDREAPSNRLVDVLPWRKGKKKVPGRPRTGR